MALVEDYSLKYKKMGLNIGELIKGTKIPKGENGKIKWHNEINEEPINAEYGIAVFCGLTSKNVMVLDLDAEELFEHFKNFIGSTFITKSGKRGFHLYFRTLNTPKSRSLTNNLGQHIDVLGQGKIAVLPPSIHPETRQPYKIISDCDIMLLTTDQEMEIQQKLVDLGFTVSDELKPVKELHDLNHVKLEGQNRSEDLLRVSSSWKVKNPELTESMLLSMGKEYNDNHFDPPYPEDKVRSIVKQAYEYGERKISENENKINSKNCDKSHDEHSIEKIVEHGEMEIFRDCFIAENDTSKVYAISKVEGYFETIDLDSQLAKDILIMDYDTKFKKILTSFQSEQAINHIKTKNRIRKNAVKKLTYIRCAYQNNTLWYDLFNSENEIIKITKDSIEIVPYDNTCPVFIRTPYMSEQVRPNKLYQGNPLYEYFKLLRKENDLVFQCNVIALFLEQIGVPMPILGGATNDTKTTSSALIKMLVDPSGKKIEHYGIKMPTKEEDFATIMNNNYIVIFDNLSKISNNQSDMLCMGWSGISHSVRKLYEQGIEKRMSYKTKVILNGITINIDRDDLARRSEPYTFPPFKKGEKKSEEKILAIINELMPDLIGHTFVILQKAMTIYNKIKSNTEVGFRGDFGIWGEAISQALGNPESKFLESLEEKEKIINEKLSQENALLPFIHELFSDDRVEYCTSVTDFVEPFKAFASNNYDIKNTDIFPSSVGKLSDIFTRSDTLLNANSYRYEFRTTTKSEIHNNKKYNPNTKLIEITKIKEVLFQ